MIRADMIPDEVVEAAADELKSYFDTTHTKSFLREMSRTSIAAALNAWPGTVTNYSWDASHGRLILPLPQEVSDDPV